MSTPVFAVVKYKNGIVFNVDETKLQVTQNQPTDDITQSQPATLTCKYVQKLPHVKYLAVGINFQVFIECANPEKFVMDRFLKPGIADFEGTHLEASGLRFVYSLPSTRLRISLDSGKVNPPNNAKQRSGILIDANYHMDLPGENTNEEIEEATSLHAHHYTHFVNVTHSILGLEDL